LLTAYVQPVQAVDQADAFACELGEDCRPGPVSFAVNTPQPATPTATATATLPPTDTPTPTSTPLPPTQTPTVPPSPTASPTTEPSPTPPVSDTPLLSIAVPTETVVASVALTASLVAQESYTSTDQVHARQSAVSAACPTESAAIFDIIPIEGAPFNHPDYITGDLNLSRRGYQAVNVPLHLVEFNGDTDPDAPQLVGLFQPRRVPAFVSAWQMNDWLWNAAQCGGSIHGCPGGLLPGWETTLLGMSTTPGELLTIPQRGAEIYPGGYRAMVLFADDQQIVLGYTRRDTVAVGYAVHIMGVCVDANLLALYRAQNNVDGWRSSGGLPALHNNQTFGTAQGDEIKIAIRDNGSFMDPRSGKDWWRGY
jgi:hypothetical protein